MAISFDRLSNKYHLVSYMVIFCGALVVNATNAETINATPKKQNNLVTHKITEIPKFSLEKKSSPDTSVYNLKAVRQKIPESKSASISLQRITRNGPLKDFVRNTRLLEWAKRQFSSPKVISIDSGVASLSQIAKAVGKDYLEEVSDGIYIARLPIVVQHNATLLIDDDKELRLSQERGAFLVNDGSFFAINTQLIGWNETSEANAFYKEKYEFRPFFVSWGGSETYIINSSVESLGYFQSKSYGITFSQYKENDHMDRKPPSGWIIGSTFFDLYYGFYCYEAENVVIFDNTYKDNILYGIDPHDRSSHLLIANNHVYGTRKKHGIIISREVNDSWIINNRTHNNKLSGIVLDRDSQRNLIANNLVYSNGGDGITLYESSNNQILSNIVIDNTRQGIRVRNSNNIQLGSNTIARNKGYGIFAQVKDLSDTGRDFLLDPYEAFTNVWVSKDNLLSNHNGPIYISPTAKASLFEPNFIKSEGSKNLSLKGALAHYQHLILDILYRKKSAVAIEPINQPVINKTGS